MNTILPALEQGMVLIEATNTTQGGKPVVRVNGQLYVVDDVEDV